MTDLIEAVSSRTIVEVAGSQTTVIFGENEADAKASAASAAMSAAAAGAAGRYYSTIAAGIAATTVGQMFTSDEGGTWNYYLRTAGSPYYSLYRPVLAMDAAGTSLIAGGYNTFKHSHFGYGTGYRALVLGNGANQSVALNYDPVSITSGAGWNGDGREVIVRNGTNFITPNSAQTAWHTTMSFLDGMVGIGTSGPSQRLSLQTTGATTAMSVSDGTSTSYFGTVTNAAELANLSQAGDAVVRGSNGVVIAGGAGGYGFRVSSSGNVGPGSDNAQSLGQSSVRWSVVYAGTGSINTSDERAKREIGAIPDEWLDAWADVQWSRFKFIEGKRWHVGLIAQQVHAAFAARGLDAFEIGLCCFDEWAEQREPIFEQVEVEKEIEVTEMEPFGEGDEAFMPVTRTITRTELEMRDTGETRVTLEAGDRWGLRYDECQAIEAAWQRREIERLKADLAAMGGAN